MNTLGMVGNKSPRVTKSPRDYPSPSKSLEVVTREFTERIQCDFAQEIGLDPRAFKKQILRVIRRQLPPRRGRPAEPRTQIALAMLRQGKTVREILRSQIRGFEQLDTYGRMLAEKALRQAIARRRRSQVEGIRP